MICVFVGRFWFCLTLYNMRCLTMRVSSAVDLRPNRGLRQNRPRVG